MMTEFGNPVDFLFHPMAYPAWWLIGAILVGLLIVGWIAGVIVWTLPVEVLRTIPVVRSVTYRVLKFKFARSLARIGERHRNGQLETRAAFHEISSVFRRFVAYRTGYQAQQMTATDMSNSPLSGPALQVLAKTYPGQFADADPRAVPDAVEAARAVVKSWS